MITYSDQGVPCAETVIIPSKTTITCLKTGIRAWFWGSVMGTSAGYVLQRTTKGPLPCRRRRHSLPGEGGTARDGAQRPCRSRFVP